MKSLNLDLIKKDFEQVSKIPRVHSVLIFGSQAKNSSNKRSDIDICIVVPGLNNTKEYLKLLKDIWENADSEKYDIKIFEELPLYLKASVIKSHRIIFSRNESELFYYFYCLNKIWEDQSVNWMEKKYL